MAARIARLVVLGVGFIGVMLPLAQARGTVITFGGLPGSNGDPLISYQESGFTVARPPGLGSSFLEWFQGGNPGPAILSAWPGGFPGTRSVQITWGGLFTFDGVDIATGEGSVEYSIRGLLEGADVLALTGSADHDTAWTHVLGDGSTLIDTLVITLSRISAYSALVDNIGVTAVPEPATLALLALGLAGLLIARRVDPAKAKR